ncbi:hypothetical protein A3Q56_05840 [Intoshia linei]|uniref:Uncharacterized protein n=1 Tax=Intoshia linei TaxID=1819745 RepID=A0A177AY43_9BILA|nr:hypothetical protein A3Q56_05840 [Intoshia linei]
MFRIFSLNEPLTKDDQSPPYHDRATPPKNKKLLHDIIFVNIK